MGCLYCESDLTSDTSVKIVDKNNNYIVCCNDCFDNIFNKLVKCSNCGCNIAYDILEKSDDRFCFVAKIKDSTIGKKGILCDECNRVYVESNADGTMNDFRFVYNNLKEYYYKPTPKFYKLNSESKDNIYMGVELEIGKLSSSEKVNKFCNEHAGSIFYFKRDASIASYGCEIVTHPCTLKYHKSVYSNWNVLFNDINRYGFKSGTEANTGIHIHVNRSCLTNEQIKKMDLFVNHFQSFFEKLAGRSSTHYAAYHEKTIRSWGHSTTSRYASVNFENSHTIEFRIFNGSTKKEELFKDLEVIHALVTFSNKLKYEELYEDRIKVENDFKHFVKSNPLYKELDEYITEKHI